MVYAISISDVSHYTGLTKKQACRVSRTDMLVFCPAVQGIVFCAMEVDQF